MKKTIKLLACLTILSTVAVAEGNDSAEEKFEENWLTTEIGTGVFNKYVDQNGIMWADHVVIQSSSSVTLNRGPFAGLYVEFWHSAGLNNLAAQNDYADEIDGTIGWAGEAGPIDLDVGLAYLNTIKFGESEGDVFLPFLEISKTFELSPEDGPDCENNYEKSIRPFLRGEFSVPANGNDGGLSSGNSLFAGMEFRAQVADDFTFIPKITFVFDDGVYGHESAVSGDGEIRVEYVFNEILTIHGSGRVVGPFTQSTGPGERREKHFVYGGGITLTF